LKPLALATALFSCAAFAQDLELDLSEAKTPKEFQPSIVFIGVTPAEADAVLSARAKLLEAELLKAVKETEQFAVVKTPQDAAGVSTEARKCVDFACLEGLTEKLGVHRAIWAQLTKSGPNTLLSIGGFDATLPSVLPAQVESADKQEKAKTSGFAGFTGKSQAQLDKEFVAKAKPVFNQLLKALETPLGKIAVDVIDQKAVTRIKGKEIGTGNFEKLFPAASYDLEVECEGYNSFTQTVKVEPTKTSAVTVTLVAKAVEKPVQQVVVVEENPNAVYKRPGVFIAAAGLVAMAVGFYFGATAANIEKRAVPGGDGILGITRAQALSAQTDATMATILITAGAVVLAGGAAWAFVLPIFQKKPAAAPAAPGPSEGGEGSGFGVTLGVGGHF
jgi:hypothetical protein